MDWFVMRHPETDGVAVVPESSLDIHRPRGWVRCSDAIAESGKDHLRLGEYTIDLDAAPDTSEPAKSAPAKPSKEKS